jgi:cysteine-rich repeat protein
VCMLLDGGTGTDGGTDPAICGDGVVSGAEACDDGNSRRGDGCENDCSFSCIALSECDDANPCDGVESCGAMTHACAPGTPLVDGTDCGPGRGCRGGTCALASCGDGNVDPLEECDDANLVGGDGCESDCTYSCTSGADCDDAEACDGVETCSLADHTCAAGAISPDGTACDRGGSMMTRDICRGGSCLPSQCGDGYLDAMAGEACDDGNSVNADGCDTDCTFSCQTNEDCDDGLVCDGSETCDGPSHRCTAGTAQPDGTPCATGLCLGGVCGGGSDGGTGGHDGGGLMTCVRDRDCATDEQCCGTCPTAPNVCYPTLGPCPLFFCTFDAGF